MSTTSELRIRAEGRLHWISHCYLHVVRLSHECRSHSFLQCTSQGRYFLEVLDRACARSFVATRVGCGVDFDQDVCASAGSKSRSKQKDIYCEQQLRLRTATRTPIRSTLVKYNTDAKCDRERSSFVLCTLMPLVPLHSSRTTPCLQPDSACSCNFFADKNNGLC